MEAINVVVGLVIALIIVVLLISILTGKLGSFSKAVSCSGTGGKCTPSTELCGENTIVLFGASDCKENTRCCLPR